ncbi:hypothetical protein MTO96_021968 [Rhipicephalus appendiculatus]
MREWRASPCSSGGSTQQRRQQKAAASATKSRKFAAGGRTSSVHYSLLLSLAAKAAFRYTVSANIGRKKARLDRSARQSKLADGERSGLEGGPTRTSAMLADKARIGTARHGLRGRAPLDERVQRETEPREVTVPEIDMHGRKQRGTSLSRLSYSFTYGAK